MKRFNSIALTHHTLELEEIGRFHVEPEQVVDKMNFLKQEMGIQEIMYLSTCNRVEFAFVTEDEVDAEFVALFIKAFDGSLDYAAVHHLADRVKFRNGINAVNHLIEVASSVDSMVVGEREIITQVKDAFEFSRKNNISGDTIRLVMRHVIETAKKVYTHTEIASKPVSVVSLAYHQLREKNIGNQARIVVVGAGVTNTNMCRFLKKHGYSNFIIYNRTKENGDRLAEMVGGEARLLSELKNHQEGFDVLVTCTASKNHVITPEIYAALKGSDCDTKTVIDLSIPADLDPKITSTEKVDHISIAILKAISDKNLEIRKKELIKVHKLIYDAVEEFKEIFKMRQVELRMRSIPERVKEIRSLAMTEVFSKELSQLDEESKEVLDKILNYMEKKYVSVPMLMAKELLQNDKIA